MEIKEKILWVVIILTLFVLAFVLLNAMNNYKFNKVTIDKINTFNTVCQKFDVQVDGNTYRLSCDKGFVYVDEDAYRLWLKQKNNI